MANKLPVKLLRFFTLFTIKEGYLASRDLLGFFLHPFKTTTVMFREKDPVQILLIFGLPFYFWVGAVMSILVGRFLFKIPLFPMGIVAKISLLLVSVLAGLIFSYLTYWLVVYVNRRKGVSWK